nr:AMP-binding protein [Flavobacterium caeni]
MAIPTYHNVHTGFKLNGFHLDKDDLCRVAYSFIKEGDDFEKPVGHFILDWFDDLPYVEMTTSGTTGKPKQIRIDKQAMVNSALATGDFFDLQPGDRIMHCLPVKYIAGKMMLVRAFVLGLDTDFVEPSAKPFAANNDQSYDFVAMVPLQAQQSLDKLRKTKKLIVGGVGISKSLEKELRKLPTEVWETYGMTETITHIAAKRIGEKAFTVLPNVTLSYDDNNCLVIHAPRISSGIIVTNDLVKLVNENQFQFLGRFDNVINSGGIKLIPEQIEDKLAGSVNARFFVSGVPDEKLGQKLVLFIEGEPQTSLSFDDLDKYEKPKEVIYVARFKETETGKIMRKETVLQALNT